jgi:hypothetical protein
MSNILTIKTFNITPLKILISTLKEIFSKTNIIFTNKEITIRKVSDTVLVNTVLQANHFEVFECTKPKIIIGVNMFHLYNLIYSINLNIYDTLTIYIENKDYSEGVVSNLGFKFENSITKQCKIQKLGLIESDEEEPKQEIENIMKNKEQIS